MTLVVADASALIEYLFRTEHGMAVERTIARDDVALHVPALCDIEVAAVVRRALLARRVREDRAAEAVADYLDLPITRHGHAGFIARVLQLRQNFSAYDGVYVALAERLGAALLTCDDRLSRAVATHTSIVLVDGQG